MDLAHGMSRRSFLVKGALSTAMIAAAPALALQPGVARAVTPAAAPSGTRPGGFGPFDRRTWTPLLGKTFSMSDGAGSVNVVLVEINDLAGRGPVGDPNRFSLLFEAPRWHKGTQDIRRFRHAQIRQNAGLLAVPVGRGLTPYYEVVVNSAHRNAGRTLVHSTQGR